MMKKAEDEQKNKRTTYADTNSLLDKLCTYSRSDAYPFHMPGHKRNIEAMEIVFPNPYQIDITEIEGFDNLHHPEGILKDSMEWAARIYGSDQSYYLVNGSSCGILSAVSACVSRRGKLLISRNCHKAVYHAILLNELYVEYVYPQVIDSLGILGGILPEDVEEKLKKAPEIEAVFIVSPTYDGMVSDIKKIAEIVHRYGKVLIVDEAHGAHLPFAKPGDFPSSALRNGADIIIQSLHKTLPALTQTAVLHIREGFLSKEQFSRLKMYLPIYQSSSPSYVLMAGIENGISLMDRCGQEMLSRLKEMLDHFRKKVSGLSLVQVPGNELAGKYGVFAVDESKLLIMLKNTVLKNSQINGKWLSNYLRQEFQLEMEMDAPNYVLALTSIMDEPEGFLRLFSALSALDRKVLENVQETPLKNQKNSRYNIKRDSEGICTIFNAVEQNKVLCPLRQCEGKLAGEFVYLYPPGIPCLVPGERITREIILQIEDYFRMGLSVQGMEDSRGRNLKVLVCPSGHT